MLNTMILNAMMNRDENMVKDLVLRSFDHHDPSEARNHPNFGRIDQAIRWLHRHGWDAQVRPWAAEGMQLVLTDPSGRTYVSHYKHRAHNPYRSTRPAEDEWVAMERALAREERRASDPVYQLLNGIDNAIDAARERRAERREARREAMQNIGYGVADCISSIASLALTGRPRW